jgi:hypothetical protein
MKFSIWASLGGLAYLLTNGHIAIPRWILWRWTALIFPLMLALLRAAATIWFGFRLREEARIRDTYRRRVVKLLGIVDSLYPDRGITFRNVIWIIGEELVTFLIALAAILIIQNSK